MARRWLPKPEDKIQEHEHVGRRIFDEPKLRGFEGQPDIGILHVNHFREERGEEVSLDRLGRTAIEPKVKSYLLPRCKRHGLTTHKPRDFQGWAVVKAKDLVNKWTDLPNWRLHASPEVGEEGLEFSDNVYHAHAVCTEQENSVKRALYLRHLFERGHFELVKSNNDLRENSWLLDLKDRVMGYFRR